MNRGTGKHPVTPGAVVTIRTDAEFTLYAMFKGERSSILGPNHNTERHLKLTMPFNVSQIELTIRKSGRWVIDEVKKINHQEVPDKTPVEIGVKEDYDPLAERIQQIVQNEMSKLATKHGFETLEESDDFDIGDEDEPTSQYELSDLQEDYAPPAKPETTPKSKEPDPSCPPAEVSDSAPAVQPDKTPAKCNPKATPSPP